MKELTREPIAKTLEKNYLPYAMSVILSRALPEIDGLKPSHRKLLFTMYKMGLLSGQKTKSANVVGQTMKLNPHGDAAIYSTLVRLASGNESLLYPYVDSKGNFGKVFSRDMQFAAARYTEVKLMPICKHIFREVEKDTVDFVPNYDGTMYEPVLLPVRFPTILVNPNRGIAVGMASNICSFHLSEVIDATIALMRNPKANLMRQIKGPDFSTGGSILYDEAIFHQILEHGTGTFKIRANWRHFPSENLIEIYEIPYTTTIEAIIDKVIALVKEGVVREINDIRDESDLKGLKIAIDLKRGTDAERLMQKLFRETTLEDNFSCNFNMLINAYPQQIGVRQILLHWIDFRMGCIRRALQFDISRHEEKLHLIQGLKQVLLDIDKVILLIRNTEREKDVVPNLMREMLLDQAQAEFVANIRLRNINREYLQNRIDEEQDLLDHLKRWREIYESDQEIYALIKEELLAIKKEFQQKRKSTIIDAGVIEEFEEVEEEEITPVVAIRTREHYVKIMSQTEFDKKQTQRLKLGDEILQEIPMKSDGELLFFTSQHNVYKLRVESLEWQRASDLGVFLPTELELPEGETVIYMAGSSDFEGWMLFAFKNGKVARVPMSSYATKTNRRMLTNAYSDLEELVSLVHIKEPRYLLLTRYANQKQSVAVVHSDLISEKITRHSQGVSVMRMTRHSHLVNLEVLDEKQAKKLEKLHVNSIPTAGRERRPLEFD